MAQTHSLDLEKSSSQYASITDASQTNLDPGTSDFSIMAWVKVESVTNGDTLVSKRSDGTVGNANFDGFSLFMNGSSFAAFFRDTSESDTDIIVDSNITPAVGQWYHVAATYDRNGSLTIYVNGKSQNNGSMSGSGGGTLNLTGAFTVGCRLLDGGSADLFADTKIKDVRYYDTLLTASEVASEAHVESSSDANLQGEWNFNNAYTDGSGNGNTLTASGSPVFATDIPWEKPTGVSGSTNLETNLVSYWELEEASGTRTDSKGSNDLTDNNTVTQGTGKQGNAADFERSNSEHLSRADNASLSITGDLSVSFWSKPETVHNGNDAWFSKSGGSGNFGVLAEMSAHTTERIRFFVSSNGTSITQKDWNITLVAGTWYHFVFVYDASAGSCELFIDGVSYGKVTGLPTSIYDNTTDFQLGASDIDGSTGRHYDGLLDEFALYDRILNYGDILDLYNAGSGIPYTGGTNYTQALTETITAVDSLAAETSKAFSEVLTLVDSISNSAGKALADALALVDSATTTLILTLPTIEETITLVESYEHDISKQVSETITLVETITRSLQKGFSETVTLVETVEAKIADYFAALTETITPVDTIANVLTATISFTESIVTSDRLYGLLNGVNMKYVDQYASTVGEYVDQYFNV